ncbi:Spy/CpxP family protein refolding chaperone [Draconibacterium halophilum]|uniref:Periplasmic heavy metal sensor n=1 Tax=Draconibacterium halophilum TaxID=2706887 RepID=A0A6C0R8N6_9BACT|nr:periplasmic heavy metal sensor [Draconibacterium halophilum]QIA06784.1 periplasmic heavy metal sensor [Draconibacterium halophilum]
MARKNTYRILIWVVVILAATNLSMGISFWYHKQQDQKAAEEQQQQVEMPSEQRTRFFREQLNLQPEQVNSFRELNRNYNRSARRISDQLTLLRIEMVEEMGKAEADTTELHAISSEIGAMHKTLKNLTADYYLDMKAVCNADQQEKLKEVFLSMTKSKEDVSLPQRGGRRHGRQNRE